MKSLKLQFPYCLFAIAALFVNLLPIHAEVTNIDGSVPVSMTVTASVAGGKRMPTIDRDQVNVRSGRARLEVTEWSPARGARAGLELYILIDDASGPVLGAHLDDLRDFINAQPSTTLVGVGYMRNATFQVVQELTTDHNRAAQALRLPFGYPGAYGSPYLSAIDLMKRWPASDNRHEVLMITDGVDRAASWIRSTRVLDQPRCRYCEFDRPADWHYDPHNLFPRRWALSPSTLGSHQWADERRATL
jgi:hypothetical protein